MKSVRAELVEARLSSRVSLALSRALRQAQGERIWEAGAVHTRPSCRPCAGIYRAAVSTAVEGARVRLRAEPHALLRRKSRPRHFGRVDAIYLAIV